MTDKDQDGTPLAEEILSTDGLPIHELEDNLDEEAEFEEEETDEVPSVGSGRRFGFGRGDRSVEREDRPHAGSVRESHERVHIDDRASAVFALLCAGILIGVLAFAWIGGVLPKAAGPSIAPLVVPTAQASSSAVVSASPVVSPAPSAS
ncbi:MAG TPA: hypothetical protein VF293_03505 [Candidatus Limnocylindrales bacterium]